MRSLARWLNLSRDEWGLYLVGVLTGAMIVIYVWLFASVATAASLSATARQVPDTPLVSLTYRLDITVKHPQTVVFWTDIGTNPSNFAPTEQGLHWRVRLHRDRNRMVFTKLVGGYVPEHLTPTDFFHPHPVRYVLSSERIVRVWLGVRRHSFNAADWFGPRTVEVR